MINSSIGFYLLSLLATGMLLVAVIKLTRAWGVMDVMDVMDAMDAMDVMMFIEAFSISLLPLVCDKPKLAAVADGAEGHRNVGTALSYIKLSYRLTTYMY